MESSLENLYVDTNLLAEYTVAQCFQQSPFLYTYNKGKEIQKLVTI